MSSFFIFKFGILLKKARGDTPPSTKKKAKITKRCLRIFEKLKRQIVFLRLSFKKRNYNGCISNLSNSEVRHKGYAPVH
ncbi:MAG: hypothetical protein IJM95_08955 [Anaerotignum sp.]|nr:hypothetical protein [Anaerotignum sp.]